MSHFKTLLLTAALLGCVGCHTIGPPTGGPERGYGRPVLDVQGQREHIEARETRRHVKEIRNYLAR